MEGVESRGKSQGFFLDWWEILGHNSDTGKIRREADLQGKTISSVWNLV